MNHIDNLNNVVDWLKTAPLHDLRDVNTLAAKVGQTGLCYDNRSSPQDASKSLYGDDVKYMISHCNRHGLWQTPLQFAAFLVFLSEQRVFTLCEIGTCTGYTSTFAAAYLQRFGLTKLDTFDIFQIVQPELQQFWKDHAIPVSYTVCDADSIPKHMAPSYDVMFIDGDHSYQWVQHDFRMYGKMAKFVAFHDINDAFCEGVVRLWKEIKQVHSNDAEFHEFLQHPNNFNLMGIGVLKWKVADEFNLI